MSQPSNDQSPFGAWPGAILVALLIAIGAIGWVQAPFTPERLGESEPGRGPVGAQDVDARLWQDPFAAVLEARRAAKSAQGECRTLAIGQDGRTVVLRPGCSSSDYSGSPGADRHRPETLARQIQARLGTLESERSGAAADKVPSVRVLGIMVSAAPSTGAAEARRRYRYAALSALMLADFYPEDAQHIGYADFGSSGPQELLPYEWLDRSLADGNRQALLLLWLDDASLAGPRQSGARSGPAEAPGLARPLARLSALLTELAPESGPTERIDFQIVGPAGSETLRAMATEYADAQATGLLLASHPKPNGSLGPGPAWVARMLSPFATIEYPFDEKGNPKADGPRHSLCGCAQRVERCVAVRPPGRTERTIVEDKDLVELLVDELGRRGARGNARIALVYQWDTEYSRRLAALVEDAWNRRATDQKDAGSEGPLIQRFSYMRGIDGQIPGTKASVSGDSKTVERSEGDPQIDYLRRMRDALLAQDSRLRESCGLLERVRQECGIRAIGVLGDDYFDKVLVLQALKPVFPNAVFFTTDLAADMLHPRDNRFTRNLVVVSGFGLSLDPERWQGAVPPLRDSYQTALFLAVRLAVPKSSTAQPSLGPPPRPRLFEIGRTRAVELAPESDRHEQTGTACGTERADRYWDPHPRGEQCEYFSLLGGNLRGLLAPVACLALGLALLLALANANLAKARKTLGDRAKGMHGARLAWALVIGATSIGACLALATAIGRDLAQGGEPWSLVEGVSIWPSEILRLVAGLVAVAFFFRGHWKKREICERIECHDFPGLGGTEVQAEAGDQDTNDAQKNSDTESEPRASGCANLLAESAGQSLQAIEIWRDYRSSCGIPRTLRKIWPEVLGFLALSWCLMALLGFPNRPTRSDLSWSLDFAIILLVLIPFLGLLFFMVHATREALKLARRLEQPVIWPDRTLRRLGLSAWIDKSDGQPRGTDIVWLDVRLIGAVTKPVGNLVWYPVLVLILIALARHPLFDAWSLPPALVLVMALAILYAVGCAWALRRAAERVREEAVRQLSAAILRAQGSPSAKDCLTQLGTMLAQVKETREGAFRPFTQQPVVQALLTLASSMSGLALLDYSAMANL